jgi:hypothetical protein
VAVRGLHDRVCHPEALEPHHAVHPTALDLPFSLQLEPEFDEERRRGLEVVDHDAHVLHALDRHALDGSGATAPAAASLGCRSWLGVAWRVIDLLERPLGGEPVADGAPERSVEFRSSRAHPRLHVRISRSGPIGIDVDAAHDIAPLWL